MDIVKSDHVDIPDAMHRNDIGDISFYWGVPGDPARKFQGGYGISHIIAQHGEAIARKMVDVIAYGNIGNVYGPEGGQRMNIIYEGNVAVLSIYRHKNKETWLLTGWKEGAFDEPGSDSALSGTTPLNRPGMGAETSVDIPAGKY